jgi:hypothetical protein
LFFSKPESAKKMPELINCMVRRIFGIIVTIKGLLL